MRWRINGADQDTGDKREFWVDAPSEHDAREIASQYGIMVSSILRDPPVVVNTPDTIKLDKAQFKKLRVSEMTIAGGVVIGLFVFIGICVLIGILLVTLGVFGAASFAEGVGLIHNLHRLS